MPRFLHLRRIGRMARKRAGLAHGHWVIGQYAYSAANLCADGYGIERGFVQKAAAEWQQSSGFRVFNSPDMPKHVLKLRKYFSCSYSRCEASIAAPKRVEDVRSILEQLLTPRGKPLLLSFGTQIVQCCSWRLNDPFECEMLAYATPGALMA